MGGRLPIDQVATASAVTGQDAVWIVVRALSTSARPFKLNDVVAGMMAARRPRLSANKKTVSDYLTRLAAAGVLQVAEDGYCLPVDPGPKAPRVRGDGSVVEMGAGRRAIWRTIRILGQFTLDDLVKLGSTEEVQIGLPDARKYIHWLVKAQYLIVVERPRDTSLPTIWRLVPSKSTGPMPPQIQRRHSVYDPNLRRVVWSEEDCL